MGGLPGQKDRDTAWSSVQPACSTAITGCDTSDNTANSSTQSQSSGFATRNTEVILIHPSYPPSLPPSIHFATPNHPCRYATLSLANTCQRREPICLYFTWAPCAETVAAHGGGVRELSSPDDHSKEGKKGYTPRLSRMYFSFRSLNHQQREAAPTFLGHESNMVIRTSLLDI